jgi:hypothetical protein
MLFAFRLIEEINLSPTVLSALTPLGLPLGYIVASLLPIASLQRLPFLRHRLTWLLLFAMLWSLLIVFWSSGAVSSEQTYR